jgi:hypothetical protein
VLVDATSQVDQQPGYGPSAFLTGTMGAGQPITLSLRGPAGAPAALLLGTTSTFSARQPLALGALLVPPALVLGGLAVPGTGRLDLALQVPSSWPGDTVVLAQFLLLDPARNEVQGSNAFSAITR